MRSSSSAPRMLFMLRRPRTTTREERGSENTDGHRADGRRVATIHVCVRCLPIRMYVCILYVQYVQYGMGGYHSWVAVCTVHRIYPPNSSGWSPATHTGSMKKFPCIHYRTIPYYTIPCNTHGIMKKIPLHTLPYHTIPIIP